MWFTYITHNCIYNTTDLTCGEFLTTMISSYGFYIFQTGNKKESEKLTKNIIKIIVKLSILYKNDQFDSNELELANNFKDKFRELTMIAVSFYEIEFSYDKNYLTNYLFKCREILKELIKRHLTDKTLSRVDKIFDFFSNSVFLDSVFINPAISDLTEIVQILINDLKELLDKDL